jgi:histidine phosphotransferase ChpT
MRPMRMDAQLARTLSARLCHDLGGAVGTLAGTLDLVGEGDAEMLGLAREAATVLRQRLRLYAAAWGGATADADGASLARLLESAPAAPRVSFRLDHLAPGGTLPAALVPLALNAALLAAEALPRGGTVSVAGSAAAGLVVCPEGRDAAWPAGLLALLGGAPASAALQDGPRRVLAPLLLGLAEEAGWAVALAQGGKPGVPPLLLGPA